MIYKVLSSYYLHLFPLLNAVSVLFVLLKKKKKKKRKLAVFFPPSVTPLSTTL